MMVFKKQRPPQRSSVVRWWSASAYLSSSRFLVKRERQTDFLNTEASHQSHRTTTTTQKHPCHQKHTLMAFCSCLRDTDERPTVSISQQIPLMCDVISMQTCYSSILLPWNTRAITCVCTQCVPGLSRGRGLSTRLRCSTSTAARP